MRSAPGALRWVVDLDGVMWQGAEPIPGSAAAVSRLTLAGHHVVFCTNHACSPSVKREQLASMGVPAAEVLTSAEVVADSCSAAERILVMGEGTLVEVLRGAGLDVVDVREVDQGAPVDGFDVVIVGATPDWDRSRTGLVADAVRNGARYLATNSDPTYPISSPSGPRLLPGAGAIVAAVSTTSGRSPTVTGKPNATTIEVIERRYGHVDMVVGDRPDTDGQLAVGLGTDFALVLSGVTTEGDLPVTPAPRIVGGDLAEIVDHVLETGPSVGLHGAPTT